MKRRAARLVAARAVVLLAALVLLTACSPPEPAADQRATEETTRPATTTAPSEEQPSKSPEDCEGEPVALGAFVKGMEEEPEILDRFADRVGGMPAVALLYDTWEADRSFDPTPVEAMAARGATPMLTWSPWDPERGREQRKFSLQKISAGRFDGYVRRWARGMADYGEPVYLRFAHEMNGSWYPWSTAEGNAAGNDPADYVAAWRRIHGIFEQEGADNVVWVWSPTADVPVGDGSLRAVYPGDGYVDWVGLDGYNWGTDTAYPWSGWKSFGEIFDGAYDEVAGFTDKPVMIAETASAEAGGSKAAWIRQGFLETLPERLPRVRAVVWFSSDKETDWRVESSPEALAAYRDVVADCRYAGEFP